MTTIPDLRAITLPSQLMFRGHDLAPKLLEFVNVTVVAWTAAKMLSPKQGYGLACTGVEPFGTLARVDWDDPQELLAYGVATPGAEIRYAWNAARKLRMLFQARQHGLNTVSSSLEIAQAYPTFTADRITDEEGAAERTGGPIRWANFPYGGAGYFTDGKLEVGMGFSVWTQAEDHRVTAAAGTRVLELASAVA